MTIPGNVNTKQNMSLVECPDNSGKVARRVTFCEETSFRPSGLTLGGLITIVVVSDSVWTALPTTALSERNAICIQNRSGLEIKINYDNTVVGYVGIVLPDKGERYYDITDNIPLYAKSSSGNANVTIEEIA